MPVHGELPINAAQPPAAVPAAPLVDPKPPAPLPPLAPLPPPHVAADSPPLPPAAAPVVTVGLVSLCKAALSGYHPITALILVALIVVSAITVLRFAVGKVFRLKN